MEKITREYKTFKFQELSKEAKEKCLEKLFDINVDYDWWENTYEDAKMIGLEIDSFDIDRGSFCNISQLLDFTQIMANIIKQHGDTCETYKTAKEYQEKYTKLAGNEIVLENEEELREEFLQAISEDYRILLSKDYEYRTSETSIIETIEANEYTFFEDGYMFDL